MKHVLITGASSGIGLDSAIKLSQAGYFVIATVRKLNDQVLLKKQLGSDSMVSMCDITDKDAVNQLVMDLEKLLNGQKLFAIINNAGIVVAGPMMLVSEEDFEKQMNVNLISTRNFTNKFIPFLNQEKSKNRSKIIFISSISGIFAAPFNGPYCVSKHALECLVDIYRRELNYINVEVIAIQPGPIKTKIWAKSEGQFAKYRGYAFDDIIDKADKIIQQTEKAALDVNLVSQRILKILSSNKNKDRYIIHKNARIFKLVAFFMPAKMLDKLIWKNLGKSDPEKYRPV